MSIKKEIDLIKEVQVVARNIWLIVAVALFLGSISYLGTKAFITPTYRSSFTAYVNNKANEENTTLTSSDISAARSLVSTYSAILVSKPVLKEAASDAGLDLTYEDMKEMVTTDTVDNTEIIQVNITMQNPENAQAFAQALSNLAPQYIAKIVEGSSMQIIDEPELPNGVYSPSYIKNTVVGIVIGAFTVAFIVVLKDLLDNRVKSVTELEERYGIAVIGTIPDLVAAQKQNFAGYSYGYGKSR